MYYVDVPIVLKVRKAHQFSESGFVLATLPCVEQCAGYCKDTGWPTSSHGTVIANHLMLVFLRPHSTEGKTESQGICA